jgi:hypothetical protein
MNEIQYRFIGGVVFKATQNSDRQKHFFFTFKFYTAVSKGKKYSTVPMEQPTRVGAFLQIYSGQVSDLDLNPDTKEKYIVTRTWINLHVQAPLYRYIFSCPVSGAGFGSGFESKVHGALNGR